MQTCSLCSHQSVDSAEFCDNCGMSLSKYSETKAALKRMQNNPRVSNLILANSGDACPACLQAQGSYAKDDAPHLPIEGCSHANGCRCFYEPVLEEIYP